MRIEEMLDLWATTVHGLKHAAQKMGYPSSSVGMSSGTSDFGRGLETWEDEERHLVADAIETIYTEELTTNQQLAVFNKHVSHVCRSVRQSPSEHDYSIAIVIMKRGMERRHFIVD